MTAIWTIRTAVGPEYLIVTTSGLGTTPVLRAVRASRLTLQEMGVTR